MEQAPGFSQYGTKFQEKIVQAMIVDSEWSARMSEVINTEYFELKYLKFLADRHFTYYAKYKCFPSFPILVTIVKDELKEETDGVLRTQVIEFLQRATTDLVAESESDDGDDSMTSEDPFDSNFFSNFLFGEKISKIIHKRKKRFIVRRGQVLLNDRHVIQRTRI